MEKKKLFQYTVILHKYSTVNQTGSTSNIKEYSDSEIIIQPTFILAKSEKDVVFKVTRNIPSEFAEDPDNIEILIRNF